LQIRYLRGWTVAPQVAAHRNGQLREKLLDAARRREIDVMLVWRLDRWGRSVSDLLANLQELEHLGVGFISLTEAAGPDDPSRAGHGGPLAVSSERETFCENGCAPARLQFAAGCSNICSRHSDLSRPGQSAGMP
jgi:hypothetical protein